MTQGLTLELRSEESGYRHYLAGQAVRAGTILELQTDSGWITGRYEWSYNPDSKPYLVVDSDTDRAVGLGPDSRLRWPSG
jgi:hypothetical protein